MIQKPTSRRERRGERGQTIALVALAMVALLGMAALAIDVVSLYLARAEAQRAADAAALAGAKMFVNSGYTSVQSAGPLAPVVQSDVCVTGSPGTGAANLQAVAAAQANTIAGQQATVQNITCNFANPGNPQITVTVQQTGLSGFFSRIWSRTASTVSATATAEAYNPSGYSNQIQVTGVKPWLVANCDPNNTSGGGNPNCPNGGGGRYNYFIDASGNPANNGQAIGQIVELTRVSLTGTPTAGSFYPIDLGNNVGACPSPGADWDGCDNLNTDYQQNIACASQATLQCGTQSVSVLSSGGGGFGGGLTSQTRSATHCLIHEDDQDGTCQGQDYFLPTRTGGGGGSCSSQYSGTAPIRIEGDYNNPDQNLGNSHNISRSDSVVTVPVYDGSNLNGSPACSGSTCNLNIVGFLQLGIRCTLNDTNCSTSGGGGGGGGGGPILEAIVINEVGCPATPTTPAVTGSGAAPIPVRLIH